MESVNDVSVGDSETIVLAALPSGYRFIAICNNGESVAYLKLFQHDNGVTPSNGIQLAPGSSVMIDQDESPIMLNGVYAVCGPNESTTLAVQAY